MTPEQHRDCIEACHICSTACEACATACLGEENIAAMARCIGLDRDCADICRLAAAAIARNSGHAAQICLLCADICQACAEECAKHSAMDHCRICAEACERCAVECRRMVGTDRDITPA